LRSEIDKTVTREENHETKEIDMTDLPTLLERVRACKGADREIDARVHHALFPDQRIMFDSGAIRPPTPPIFGRLRDFPMDGWEDWDAIANTMSAKDYTDSLDAVIALAERVLPGWKRAIYRDGPSKASALMFRRGEYFSTEHHATEALALLVAILAALIAKDGA
jgi:hypothetical protein